MRHHTLLFFMLFWLLPTHVLADSDFSFIDSNGHEITISAPPGRVVSLVPSITEMLLRMGADKEVVGLTYHSVLPPQAAGKEIVGGFFHPDLQRVAALEPEVIFYNNLQKEVVPTFQGKAVLINLTPRSLAESFDHIRLLGSIFARQKEAEEIISNQQRLLQLIQAKTSRIPPEKRLRVMRIMGRDHPMAPGDDSFQNEYIRAAGGIAPQFGKKGNIIPLTLSQWQQFNPQVIYGCGGDRAALSFLDRPGWNEVEAVKKNRILFFPCELTCRAATHQGYFVAWLAARLYGDEFAHRENFVLPQQVVERHPLSLDLDYVHKAEIIASDIKDFRNKTVAVHFNKPMKVVSTLEGQRSGITTVANHYFPPPAWGLGHDQGLAGLRRDTQQVVGFAPETTAMLFTGANMDNLAVVTKAFRDMEVTALVTAGVQGNAVRMGQDEGRFYEPARLDQTYQPQRSMKGGHFSPQPQAGSTRLSYKPSRKAPSHPQEKSGEKKKKPGTINILLMANMRLSPRAMTRAIISATEAKTAALQDLDIRSSVSRPENQATGTGTDNIIVVEGRGPAIDSSGGHSKMGELIARAVYDGVKQAIHRQNGLVTGRSVFQRLKERRVHLFDLVKKAGGDEEVRQNLEGLLLDPGHADFLKAIMAVSDDYEKGLVTDLSSIQLWCRSMAGGDFTVLDTTLPQVLNLGLSALVTKAQNKAALTP